jgi:hypothetical protein
MTVMVWVQGTIQVEPMSDSGGAGGFFVGP